MTNLTLGRISMVVVLVVGGGGVSCDPPRTEVSPGWTAGPETSDLSYPQVRNAGHHTTLNTDCRQGLFRKIKHYIIDRFSNNKLKIFWPKWQNDGWKQFVRALKLIIRNGLSHITLARRDPGPVPLPAGPPVPAGLHHLQDVVLPLPAELCPLQGDVRPVLPGPSLCPDLHQQTWELQSGLHRHHQHQTLPRPGQHHGLRLRRWGGDVAGKAPGQEVSLRKKQICRGPRAEWAMRSIVRINVMTCHGTKVVFVVFVIVSSLIFTNFSKCFSLCCQIFTSRVSIKLTRCYLIQSSKLCQTA